MITWHRTADIAPGQAGPAMQWAKEVAAHVKKTIDIETHTSMPIAGNPFRIRWSAHFESLADMEARNGKLMSDPKYLELVGRTAQLFIAGSAFDEVWTRF